MTLTKSIQQQTKWLVLLSVAVGGVGLRGCYLEKRMNYTDLHRRVRFLEMGLCVNVPGNECRPSLGWACEVCK